MSVRVYGCDPVDIEADDIAKGVAFYRDDYSTVTLFARLRGLSTSQPRATAV